MIDTLKGTTAEPSNAMRALIVFSEVVAPTTTTPQDVVDQANALGISVYPVVLSFYKYIRRPFALGRDPQASGGYGGAVPTSRPEWAPEYDPSAPEKTLAAIRVLSVGDTIAMLRLASVGWLTGVESLYPTRLEAGVVDNILNVIRAKSLSR